MADMIDQECSSRSGWLTIKVRSSQKGRTPYEVAIPPWDRELREGGVCDCEGFRFRGACSHIEKAYDEICNWNSSTGKTQTKAQRLRRLCPQCGARTRIIEADTEA